MTLTPLWLTGFEFGILATPGGGLIDTITAPASITLDTTTPRSGSYRCHMVIPATTAVNITKTIPTVSQLVVRFGVKVSSRPTTGTNLLFYPNKANSGLKIDGSGVLSAGVNNVWQTGATLDTTNWHLIEMQFDFHASPWTVAWKVDGVAQTGASSVIAASSTTTVYVGNATATNVGGYTVDFDDIIVGSFTDAATDWWGDGFVEGISPTIAGTNSMADNDFATEDALTNKRAATFNFSGYLNKIPFAVNRNTTNNAAQAAVGNTKYVEVKGATAQTNRVANAVRAVLSHSAVSGSGTSTHGARVVDGEATSTDIVAVGTTTSEATTNTFAGVVLPKPSTGWTVAAVNALLLRWGYCADITPQPTGQSWIVEVDWLAKVAVNGSPETFKWDLAGAVSKAEVFKWDLVAQIASAPETLKWDIRNAIDSAAETLKWDLFAAVAAAETFKWDLTSQVNSAAESLKWDLRSLINGSPETLKWDLYNIINGAAESLKWDLRAALDGDPETLKWDLRATVASAAETLKWDLAAAVASAAETFKWDVFNPVNAAALSLVWDIAVAAGTVNGPPLQMLWDLIAQVSNAETLLWDVRNTVNGDPETLKWDLRSLVDGNPEAFKWDLRALLNGNPETFKWDLRTTVTSAAQRFVWDLYAAVSNPETLKWDVVAQVNSAALRLVWDVITIGAVDGFALDLLWDLRAAVSQAETLKWDLRTAVSQPEAFKWDLAAARAQALGLKWDLRSLINSSPEAFKWDLRSTADGDPSRLVWDLYSQATSPANQYRWDLYAETSRTLTLLWDVLMGGGVNGTPLRFDWDVYGTVAATRILLWMIRDWAGYTPAGTIAQHRDGRILTPDGHLTHPSNGRVAAGEGRVQQPQTGTTNKTGVS